MHVALSRLVRERERGLFTGDEAADDVRGRSTNRYRRLLTAAMNSPLFDTAIIATNLERAYEAMWEVREMGLPPSHIGERCHRVH